MNINNSTQDVNLTFGLTQEQMCYLFSLEKLLTQNDIINSSNKKNIQYEKQWLREWELSLKEGDNEEERDIVLINSRYELIEKLKQSLGQNDNNNIWYRLIILEAIAFKAYYPLGKDDDKKYQKLKYDSQIKYLKEFVTSVGYATADDVERYMKMYNRAIDVGNGKKQKIVTTIVSVVAVGAITAATAGAFAGPIAVALFGSQFTGLTGAALTSACLAFAGGGAIVVGGAGMAGGVIAIVGGGALLGVASGSAAALGIGLISKQDPKFTLTQAAKLSVVLREIILNEQHDIVLAQKILAQYKENIAEMEKELKKLKLEQEKNKVEISNLKKAIEYLEKVFKDTNKFASAYDVGMSAK